jgi:hypothetical protein
VTHETEKGFGSGLRRELERKLATAEEEVAEVVAEPVAVASADTLALVDWEPEPEPTEDDAAEFAEVAALRAELEDALAREQELRESLQHHVEAYERELDADRDVALREANTEQRAAKLAEREAEIDRLKEQLEGELHALSTQRTQLLAEEARLETLARHVDSRTTELESADRDRAQAAAHVAQEVAAIAERERELKRERAALEERLRDAEARVAAREQAVQTLDAGLAARERALAEREVAARSAVDSLDSERRKLLEQSDEVQTREQLAEKRNAAREQMLTNGEAALAAWEKRLREQSERLERERAGHGQASQEAFALLAELEQREQLVGARESKVIAGEESLAARTAAIHQAEQDLRVREARRIAELDLREDKLEVREQEVSEREVRIGERERDLTTYVSQLQGSLNDRSVA